MSDETKSISNAWRYYHAPRAARGEYELSPRTKVVIDGVKWQSEPLHMESVKKLDGLKRGGLTDRIWRELNIRGTTTAPQLAFSARCTPDEAYRSLTLLHLRGRVQKTKGTSPMGRPITIYSAVKAKDVPK